METDDTANGTATITPPPEARRRPGPVTLEQGVKGMRDAIGTVESAMKAGGIDDAKIATMLAPSLAVAEKCEAEAVAWRPFGGATSFDGIDSFLEANKRQSEINELAYQFNEIVYNIMAANPEEVSLEEKASLVATAAGELRTRVGQIDASAKSAGGLLSKVGNAVRQFIAPKDEPDTLGFDYLNGDGTIRAFKDDSGAWRWVGIWSNAYKDDEDEVFPLEAHKEFIGWCDKSGHMPELWVWHMPGSRMGIADMLDIHEGFTVATGTFDKGMESAAEKFTPDDRMSHGFLYRIADKASGKYPIYRTYELSVLPGARAGNKLTGFAPLREALTMDATKEKYAREKLGDTFVDNMKANLEGARKELETKGVAMSIKEIADSIVADGAKHDAAAPAPAQAAAAASSAAPPNTDAATAAAAAGTQASLSAPPPESAPEAGGDKAMADTFVAALGAKLTEAVSLATKDITDGIAEIKSTMAQHGEQLLALKESDDTKIAAAFAPRTAPVASAVKGQEKGTEPPKSVADAAKEADTATLGALTGVVKEGPLGAVAGYMEQAFGGRVQIPSA